MPTDPEHLVPIGLAAVAREGTDLTIVAHSFADACAPSTSPSGCAEDGDLGRGRRPALAAPARRRDGRRQSVAKTNRALLVEEGWATYGVSAELAARIQHACFDDLDAPVERVGMAEVPMPYAKKLELAALPNEERIVQPPAPP